jgi:N-acetyl-gamma-glutamyl-phosphate reductase
VLSVGIIGASGFTGAELLRLLAAHPAFEVTLATGDTQAGTAVADLYPSLAASYGDLRFSEVDLDAAGACDVVFLGLPHGVSQSLVPDLKKRANRIVDLAADFRLKDASLYPQWYKEPHHAPELLEEFVYGLPEVFRQELKEATLVAVPGCYPTAGTLALLPAVRAGLVSTEGIIVDAASGVSGAGRPPKAHTTFCTVDEDFTAYGLLDHRHTPEMEMLLGASVLFTPHLAPMNRGILATCYARPAAGVATASLTTDALLELYRDFYRDEPFVVVDERSPSTKATLGSNCAHVSVRADPRTGWVMGLCAIDNLTKGASGAAVQCANLICGLEETTGLPMVGVYP